VRSEAYFVRKTKWKALQLSLLRNTVSRNNPNPGGIKEISGTVRGLEGCRVVVIAARLLFCSSVPPVPEQINSGDYRK
jgi:hypothetical protein